jgi:catechol O-methyltransferase
MALVDLAGLSDIVNVIIGSSDVSIKRLHSSGALKEINLLFLDHYKPAYITDLKLCESLGLVTEGSMLAADNVINPGNPVYLEYVRASVEKKRLAFDKGVEMDGSSVDGVIPERYQAQYKRRVSNEMLDKTVKGNPNLRYESMLVESFEPTGVPVC